MVEIDRLSGDTGWIDVGFVERERTPREIIEVGVQLHLVGVSLSSTKQFLERLSVDRSRTAVHNWVQKADLQPVVDAEPNHVAVDETVTQLDGERWWLYATVTRHEQIPPRTALSDENNATYRALSPRTHIERAGHPRDDSRRSCPPSDGGSQPTRPPISDASPWLGMLSNVSFEK